tara:strand:+ start:7042 stop:7314 length:273 start_codon:yes stop_codon:yes gene_type:complete
MSNQQENLVKLGDDAEELLKTPVFTNTINALVEATFQAFVNSDPDKSKEREATYNHYRAIVDIVNTLKQRVSVRDEINEKLKSDNSKNEE